MNRINRKNYWAIGLIAGMMVASCGTGPTSALPTITVPPITPSVTWTPESTSTPTLTLSPTATRSVTQTKTIAPTTTTAEPIATPSYPPEAHLKTQCLDVAPSLSSDEKAMGVVVLANTGDPLELLDLSAAQSQPLTGEHEAFNNPAVSPDGQWLAFESLTSQDNDSYSINRSLVIAKAGGQRVVTLPFENSWGYVDNWVNNQYLIIDLIGKAANGLPMKLALNPFTGERITLKPEYPYIYTWHTSIIWDFWAETI